MRESNPHLLLNSGIEPEFNLVWCREGNRTLIFKLVMLVIEKREHVEKLYSHLASICLGIKDFLCRESNPKNLCGDG
jgi:hypothetical protein